MPSLLVTLVDTKASEVSRPNELNLAVIMYAGAGFYNTGKDEGSSPSLNNSQRSAKNATAEPFISPSRYSETTGTPDDDADCSDDEPLLHTTPVVRSMTQFFFKVSIGLGRRTLLLRVSGRMHTSF